MLHSTVWLLPIGSTIAWNAVEWFASPTYPISLESIGPDLIVTDVGLLEAICKFNETKVRSVTGRPSLFLALAVTFT